MIIKKFSFFDRQQPDLYLWTKLEKKTEGNSFFAVVVVVNQAHPSKKLLGSERVNNFF